MAQLARMTTQVAPGQSIGRALRLLACFSEARPSHTLSELSRQLELAPSTVSRLLSVLEEYGYVRRGNGNGHYTLGLAPIALASVAISQSDLRRQSLPFLEMLADNSHYNANVAVLYEGDVLYLARVPAAKELRVYAITGTRNAPHSTAVGKILLAALPEEEVGA
ncbi:MAG TPA: helix-turn-helix domain-containing protein, partial [Thermomicrobiales bacterium]